jgi:hypothetical protein
MSQIPQLMSGRALEHGIALTVDHGGTSSAKMYVGGQAKAATAASSNFGGTGANVETSLDSLEIPANALVAGSTIRIRAAGIAPTTVSTDTLRIQLKFDTTATAIGSREIIYDTTAIDVANNDIYMIDALIQIRTATTAVAWVAYQGLAAAGSATDMLLKASFTTDITAATTLQVTGVWSTESANVCRNDIFVVDIVNPQT